MAESKLSTNTSLPPFLRIPLELRFLIYSYLLHPISTPLRIRSLTPHSYGLRAPHIRTTYHKVAGSFYRKYQKTTYHLLPRSSPDPWDTHEAQLYTSSLQPLDRYTAILGVCQQTHNEGCAMLYGHHFFNFGTDIEAVIPFFSDLTPVARANVHAISITKRPAAYPHDFEHCEWASVCEYLHSHLSLTSLNLRIMTEALPLATTARLLSADDFDELFRKEPGYEGFDWVEDLLKVEGLEKLDVQRVSQEIGPPRLSGGMIAFFALFSGSAEGFGEFLRRRMVRSEAGEKDMRCSVVDEMRRLSLK